MQAFLRKLFIFLLPVFFGIVYLFLGPPHKQQGYNYMLKSCEKGNWIYSRIFENPTPVDIAFLGTSKTICGINDSLIETELNKTLGYKVSVTNLAFCRPGRSLDFALVKDLYNHHQPKLIILEVREKEDRFSHHDFPYIADAEDIVFQHLIINQRYWDGIRLSIDRRFQYYKEHILKTASSFPEEGSNFHHKVADLNAEPNNLISSGSNRPSDPFHKYSDLKKWRDRMNQRLGMSYVKAISKMVQKEGSTLVLLYLPSYKSTEVWPPRNYAAYQKLGHVLIPPDSIINNVSNWADPDHMNLRGSNLISNFLVNELSVLAD